MTTAPNPLEDLECRCGTRRRMTKNDLFICDHCDGPNHKSSDSQMADCDKCKLRSRRTR